MTLTAPNVPETTTVITNGVHAAQSNAQVLAANPSTTKTATKAFSVTFQGATIQFAVGKPVICSPALITFLASINAPVV